MEALADADLVLVVLDGSQPASAEDDELINQAAQRSSIVVENKSDLLASQKRDGAMLTQPPKEQRGRAPRIRTSTVTAEVLPNFARKSCATSQASLARLRKLAF